VNPAKIVFFHMNQIGDFLFSLPAMKTVKDRFPGIKIISVLRPELQVLAGCTDIIDDVFIRSRGIEGKVGLVNKLLSSRTECVVTFSESPECVILSALTGTRIRAGFASASLAWVLNHKITRVGPPSTENNLRLVESLLGCAAQKRDYTGMIKHQGSAKPWLTDFISKLVNKHVVILAPEVSLRRKHKKWLVERWASTAKKLVEEYNCAVVVVGTKNAVIETQLIVSSSGVKDNVYNLAGKTSLIDLVYLLSNAGVYIGPDSGVMHMSAAMGLKCIALFGDTLPEHIGPQGVGHIIIKKSGMNEIEVNDVVTAFCSIFRV